MSLSNQLSKQIESSELVEQVNQTLFSAGITSYEVTYYSKRISKYSGTTEEIEITANNKEYRYSLITK